MSKKRLIFTLIYSDGFYNLSRNFRLQKVGNLDWLNNHYNFKKISFYIDELIIIDASRDKKKNENFFHDLRSLSKGCFAPIAAGGGINSLNDVETFFANGSDKIVINSIIHENPELIHAISNKYGNQSIIASVDTKIIDNTYRVFINNGKTLIKDSLKVYLEKIMKYPIGEIYLNSIDRDGVGQGLDLDLLNFLPEECKLPIILSGGVGKTTHFIDGLNHNKISAVSTANLFNFIGDAIKNARQEIISTNIDLPSWNYNDTEKFYNIFNKQEIY